jgi:hypothetical protein
VKNQSTKGVAQAHAIDSKTSTLHFRLVSRFNLITRDVYYMVSRRSYAPLSWADAIRGFDCAPAACVQNTRCRKHWEFGRNVPDGRIAVLGRLQNRVLPPKKRITVPGQRNFLIDDFRLSASNALMWVRARCVALAEAGVH